VSDPLSHPAFGTADLTNCERELIHLAGSIQPHGVLLVLDEATLAIQQLSRNVPALLGETVEMLLGRSLDHVSPVLAAQLRPLLAAERLDRPAPLRCRFTAPDGTEHILEGMLHRVPAQGLVLELESVAPLLEAFDLDSLPRRLQGIIAEIASATSLDLLCQTMASEIKGLIGYDRVMVYRFDPDGHGEVVAEAREAELEPYLGLHYPSSDIPQRARDLYLRNRVRVLADTGDVAVPLVPRLSPATGTDLDLSMSVLRSLSPIHIEYLCNMGVTGTLVASLMKDGRLWGLVSCHHYAPRRLPYQLRAACELLSDVFSTRLAALEATAVAHSILMVPRVEKQMVETASASGDWHQALFGVLRSLMPTFGAAGGALLYEGQVLTIGNVPGTEDLSRLAAWIAEESSGPLFHAAAIARREPTFAHLAGVASGVLALRIAPTRLDYVLWFRREQLQTVRWAGNPNKPVTGDDPNHLSPRRSFAVWTEQVRNTAREWTEQELALAQLLQTSIFDTIQQVQGIRVLIVARQLASVTRMVERSGEPMVILNERDQVLLLNLPLRRLLGLGAAEVTSLEGLASHFAQPAALLDTVRRLRRELQPWMGELTVHANGQQVALAVRADAVPGTDGGVLGTILMFTDLSARRAAEAARARLSEALEIGPTGNRMGGLSGVVEFDDMMAAVLANARTAVLSVSGTVAEAIQPGTLTSIESLTRRASEVAHQMLRFASQLPRTP
jgi:PAS domain S-box-containing protein